jgi:hypothetical protein
MGFKKYFIASILLLAIISGYTYSLNFGNYTIEIVGLAINQTLPIFIWIIVPALLLFVATIIHMIFYGSKGYFEKKAISKDIDNLQNIIKDRLLNKKSTITFKTPALKEVANILNQIDFKTTNEPFNSSIHSISNIVQKITSINKGEYVSSKDLRLDVKSELDNQNLINRIKNDSNFAVEVLKQASKYSPKIIEIAFEIMLDKKSMTTIKKIVPTLTLTNNMAKELLKKDSTASKQFAFTNNEILEYIQNNEFTNKELIQIAKNYKKTMSPEQLIKLFEDISANNESLNESYLYVLFEYEMIPQIREILINSQKDEFIVHKALLDLKDAGKHYNIDNFIN